MNIIVIVLLLITSMLWVWAFWDIISYTGESSSLKWLWIAGIVVFPIIGSLLYFNTKNKIKGFKTRKFEPKFNNNVVP
ncbi:Phospholipase_D-nuclease N-terminal [Gillisia sp. Hel1_33_143]|uniref:PLDc N-terminal domain-containing protein n=1 Tax=Gillisia sp. Hel1_33_143 TaxID=1336796 RepID=UPI00087C4F0C|nr:PLD nuclease N-terminal domain-containing protein [Gillisia sp. Hel1_33_143]SDS39882.1 Phospholipase_D-nuclease N-terminal [Gillisia sp. Hel1_33_143]